MVVNLLLWCPQCMEQHIDSRESRPHVLHTCDFCGHEWKITNHLSNGVMALPKTGAHERDSYRSAKPVCFATLKDFNEAVEYATKHLQEKEEDQAELVQRIIDAASPKQEPSKWFNSDLGCLFILLGIAAIILASGVYHYLLK